MREIKFRAWAVASKEMFYPDVEDGWELNSGELIPLPNTVLMQYTGLKDKNGKEIWEGDIIAWHGVDGRKKAEVVWCDGLARFGVEFDEDGHAYGFSKDEAERNIEIIGNIFQDSHVMDSGV